MLPGSVLDPAIVVHQRRPLDYTCSSSSGQCVMIMDAKD